jgi:hypothetical protein
MNHKIDFNDLIQNKSYFIHVGLPHYYRGTFRASANEIGYFENVVAIFPEGEVILFQGQYFASTRLFFT